MLGNSCFKSSSGLPSAAMITSAFFFSNKRIMGMQRVACPKPQLSGEMSIRLFKFKVQS